MQTEARASRNKTALQVARVDANKQCKEAVQTYCGRVSHSKRLQSAVDRMLRLIETGAAVAPVQLDPAREALATHRSLVQSVRAIQSSVSSWDAHSYASDQIALQTAISSLEQCSVTMASIVPPLNVAISEAQQSQSRLKIRARSERNNAARQWGVMGLPRNWQDLLIDLHLIALHSEDDTSGAQLAIADDAGDKSLSLPAKRKVEQLAKAEPSDIDLTSGSSGTVVDSSSSAHPRQYGAYLPSVELASCNTDEQWWKLPSVWQDRHDPFASRVLNCIKALTETRLAQAYERMKNFLTGANRVGFIRLQPVSASLGDDTTPDSWEQMQWVPQCFQSSGFTPEGSLTFGAPWLLASQPCAVRHTLDTIPINGFSSFLVNLHGDSVVFMWAMECMQAEDVDLKCDTGFTFLSQLRPAAFAEMVKRGVIKHVLLRPNTVLWVPCGMGWATVAMDTGVSGMLLIPFLNPVFARQCPKPVLETVIQRQTQTLRNCKSESVWKSVASAFIAWMEALAPSGTRAEVADDLPDSGSL